MKNVIHLKDYRRILVPVDDGDESRKAFDVSMDLASEVDGNVTLLHVVDAQEPVLGGVDSSLIEDRKRKGLDIISELTERASGRGIDITSTLEEGVPSDVIVERSNDHDLIIMGTRGLKPIGKALMGSVAENVTRNAFCPVMLIRDRKE